MEGFTTLILFFLQLDASADQQMIEKNVVFTQEPDVIKTIDHSGIV